MSKFWTVTISETESIPWGRVCPKTGERTHDYGSAKASGMSRNLAHARREAERRLPRAIADMNTRKWGGIGGVPIFRTVEIRSPRGDVFYQY
jgi:predicted DNA-binding WGR domain protein